MRQVTTTVYKFDELPTDAAKERARAWYRGASAGDDFYAESVLDDAKSALKILGYRVDKIYYSGFSFQGDGACFTGSFYASDYDGEGTNAIQAMLVDRPTDKKLARCAAELERILLACPGLSASIEHVGRYSHENSTRFSIDLGDEETPSGDTSHEDAFEEVSRDLMRWIYKNLEAEYEFASADEQVDEHIRCNEYEFTEDGGPA
jgi:hypothetical protein